MLKINGGVSVARNTGIEIANGQFMCFVDADDRIASNMIERLVYFANLHNADIVICGHYNVTLNGISVVGDVGEDVLVYEKERLLQYQRMFMLKNFEDYKPYFPMGQPWGTLYASAMIKNNNLRFIQGMQYKEDVIFNLYAAHYSKKILRINEPLYYYNNINESSLTTVGLKAGMLPRIELDVSERVRFCQQFFTDDKLFQRGLNQHLVRSFYRNVVPGCIRDADFSTCKEYYRSEIYKNAFSNIVSSELSTIERFVVSLIKHGGLVIYYYALKAFRRM